MYDYIAKRLVEYESWALIGLFTAQYLMVTAGPALLILGFGVWNPFIVLAGLLSIRLLFFFCDLQQEVIRHNVDNERKFRHSDPNTTHLYDDDK